MLTGEAKTVGKSSPSSPLARRLQPERGCSACEIRGIAEQIYIEALLEILDEVCPLLRDSAGFCLPHLSQIVDQMITPVTLIACVRLKHSLFAGSSASCRSIYANTITASSMRRSAERATPGRERSSCLRPDWEPVEAHTAECSEQEGVKT